LKANESFKKKSYVEYIVVQVQRWNVRCGIWIWIELLLWKMQEIHQGQCEECKQHQGVVFCNLFIITYNLIMSIIWHNCVNILKSKLHVSLKTVYGALLFLFMKSLITTPKHYSWSLCNVMFTAWSSCYDYVKKLSEIKSHLKLGPCHMYWGILLSVEIDITCALYSMEITVK
jgi:hypothetical protein